MGERICIWEGEERNRTIRHFKVLGPVIALSSMKNYRHGEPAHASILLCIKHATLTNGSEREAFRYIEDPLLIGGKKFDLRLYVVVVSYRPLKAYLSDLGFARFCNIKYTTEAAEMDNQFVHLTNVAIQRRGVKFNSRHGNKWPLQDLKVFLESTHEKTSVDKLFKDLELAILNSLKSVQNVMINDSHCFELYGYDMIIDSNLKPWLIEVSRHTIDSHRGVARIS